MKWVLLLVLGTGGAVIVAASAALLLARHRLLRRNRVDPRTPNGVPFAWLADPRVHGRLHRRVLRAGRVAAQVGDRHRPVTRRFRRTEVPMIVELADELRAHAAAVDADLGSTRRWPSAARAAAVRRIEADVVDVEAAATRLVVLSREVATPPVQPHHAQHLSELGLRIDHLTEAHRELRSIEAGDGEVALPPPVPRAEPALVERSPHR
ncbi:MAG: hypothetical protein JWM05_2290 [Acidimicrobiales bacterium]|nr:hypothetical protein [Acidimicrobiales bacterium]